MKPYTDEFRAQVLAAFDAKGGTQAVALTFQSFGIVGSSHRAAASRDRPSGRQDHPRSHSGLAVMDGVAVEQTRRAA